VSHLHELGCKVWVHIAGENPKIYNRSIECVLVGYSDNSKAYRCLERSTGRIHTTRNTVFAESQDLRIRPLQPGVTVGDAETLPLGSHTPNAGPTTSEETAPSQSTPAPCRSARISNLSGNILGAIPSTYMHDLNAESTTTNIPSPDCACVHGHVNINSDTHAPDGFVHFTFDDEEW